MWNHLANALQYSKGFPIHEGMLIPGYPYLFQVYLATFFQLSGLPSPISYQALFALSFISVLSFYSFIKRWFSKENVVSIAVLLVSLLGFGSLYTLNLKVQNPAIPLSDALSNAIPKTYDIMDIMIIGPTHSNVVPIIFIALPTLFMFLYLLRKNMNGITKSFLYAVLVAVSFLGHPDTSFFMGLALLLYAVIMKGEDVKTAALGGILGLLIVALVDVSAPARLYIWAIGGFSLALTFFASLLLFALSYLTSLLVRRFRINRNFFSDSFKKNAFSLTSWTIIFAYLFSLITWLYVLPNCDAITFGHYTFTPFFVWAIRFGPIGLFSILCLSLYLGDVVKDNRLTFFLAIAAIGFALEQLANYYPVYAAYRFATLTLIGVVALAAYFVVKSSSLLAGKKRIVLTAILLFVMIPGMLSSSSFYYDRAQLKPAINSYELDALSFVGKNLPSNSSVLTFTSDSENKLETFGGVNTVQVCQRWSYAFLSAQDVSVILYLFGSSNVRYVYLSGQDWQVLNSSQSVLRDLLGYFPVAFHNDYVTIFEVRNLSIPSESSKLAILNFLTPTTPSFQKAVKQNQPLLMSVPSFLMLNYSIDWLPLQENTSKAIFIDSANVSQWHTFEGLGNVSMDVTDKVDETPALALYNIQADKSGYFAVSKNGNWNFSDYDSLQLWVKVPKEMNDILKIILRGDGGTWMQWFVSNFPRDKWVKLNLPFDEPTGMSNPTLNLTAIRQFDVGFATKPFANISSLKIDEIVLAKTSSFLPEQEINYLLNNTSTLMFTQDPNSDLSTLMPWVESGNKIIVLNEPQNNAGGFFFNLLDLRLNGQNESNQIMFPQESVSLPKSVTPFFTAESSDVTTSLWYGLNDSRTSPFIFSKKLGSGEIIYMTLPSTLLEPKAENLPLLLETFKNVLDFTKLDIPIVNPVVHPLPSYSTVEEYLDVNGSIKIVTSHLLNPKPIDATVEVKTANSSTTFANITINSLVAYRAQIIAQNTSMRIGFNSTHTSYVSASPLGNEELRPIELSVDEATLEISNSSSTISLSFKNAHIVLYTSDLSLFIKSPVIESSGVMYLNSATITYGAPYTALAGAIRSGITIKGNATVATSLSANNLILIDNFWYSGTASKDQTLSQTTFEIPWVTLLTSPIFFVFLLLILIVAFMKLGKNNELMSGHKNSSL